MAAASVASSIVKYGPDALEFIKRFNDKTVVMKCHFPTDDPSSNIIQFEAVNNRSWFAQTVGTPVPPWGIEIPTPTRPEAQGIWDWLRGEPPPDPARPNRFKYIEIECNDKNEFRHFMDKYQGRPSEELIPQAAVIERLKIMDGRFCKISKMKATRLAVDEWIAPSTRTVFQWGVWKLEVVIDPCT